MNKARRILDFVIQVENGRRRNLGWEEIGQDRKTELFSPSEVKEFYRKEYNAHRGAERLPGYLYNGEPFYNNDLSGAFQSVPEVVSKTEVTGQVEGALEYEDWSRDGGFEVSDDGFVKIRGRTFFPQYVYWSDDRREFVNSVFEKFDTAHGNIDEELYDVIFPIDARHPSNWVEPTLGGARADSEYKRIAKELFPSDWNEDTGFSNMSKERFYELYTESYKAGHMQRIAVLSTTVGVSFRAKTSQFNPNFEVEYSTTGREDIFNPMLFFIALTGYCSRFNVDARDFVSAFNIEMNERGLSVLSQSMSVEGQTVNLKTFFATHVVSTRQILRIGAFQVFVAKGGKSYLGDGLYVGMEYDCLMTLDDQLEYFISMIEHSFYNDTSDENVLSRISHAMGVLAARGIVTHSKLELGSMLLPYLKKSNLSLDEIIDALSTISAKMGELDDFLEVNSNLIRSAKEETRTLLAKEGLSLVKEIRQVKTDLIGVRSEFVQEASNFLRPGGSYTVIDRFQSLLKDESSESSEESE